MSACNTGAAYNIFRDIDRDFAVHYFVHGTMAVQIVQEVCDWQVPVRSSFSQIWWLAAELLQYHDNAFEYASPIRCKHTPDKGERGWGRPDV